MTQGPRDFWTKVDMSAGLDACWPWTGRVGSHGFGAVSIKIDGEWQVRTASAVALWLVTGRLPKRSSGEHTLHSCDNKLCCNPTHLTAGTACQNARDASVRRLLVHGEEHHAAKLSAEKVRELRARAALGEPVTSLARRFGIRHATARQAINRETWKHVE